MFDKQQKLNEKQEKINKQLLQALDDLIKAQKLQRDMIVDLKEYMDKRDLLHEQMNRSVLDMLIKIAKYTNTGKKI